MAATNFPAAYRRLEAINTDLNPAVDPNDSMSKAIASEADNFKRHRAIIHGQVKVLRTQIRERDEADLKDPTKSSTMSAKIRKGLKETEGILTEMEKELEKEKKKKKKTPPEVIEDHTNILNLCRQHFDEISKLNEARFAAKMQEDRQELLQNTRDAGDWPDPSKWVKMQLDESKYESELPDIDPQVEADLEEIAKRNAEIDEDLDDILGGVTQLKSIAVHMGDEVDKQNTMLDEVEKKVDRVNVKTENLNAKMKQVLEGTVSGEKWIIIAIFTCIILALVGYIISAFL